MTLKLTIHFVTKVALWIRSDRCYSLLVMRFFHSDKHASPSAALSSSP